MLLCACGQKRHAHASGASQKNEQWHVTKSQGFAGRISSEVLPPLLSFSQRPLHMSLLFFMRKMILIIFDSHFYICRSPARDHPHSLSGNAEHMTHGSCALLLHRQGFRLVCVSVPPPTVDPFRSVLCISKSPFPLRESQARSGRLAFSFPESSDVCALKNLRRSPAQTSCVGLAQKSVDTVAGTSTNNDRNSTACKELRKTTQKDSSPSSPFLQQVSRAPRV